MKLNLEKIILASALFLSTSINLYAKSESKIAPFTTDGCSSFPDGTLRFTKGALEWRHCCIIHDFDYYTGGSELAKDIADSRLSQCVDESIDTRFPLGVIMYSGVQIGGLPKFLMIKSKAGFRWGYGISPNQLFTPNSNSQHEKLINKLSEFKESLLEVGAAEKMELTEEQNDQVLDFVSKKIDFMGSKPYKGKRYKNITQ